MADTASQQAEKTWFEGLKKNWTSQTNLAGKMKARATPRPVDRESKLASDEVDGDERQKDDDLGGNVSSDEDYIDFDTM